VRDPKDVGGFPELKFDQMSVPVDSHGDGMPARDDRLPKSRQ
jgi:hypothetical protein